MSYHELLECSTGRAEYLQSPKAEGSAVCDPSAWLHVFLLLAVRVLLRLTANSGLTSNRQFPTGGGPSSLGKERERESVERRRDGESIMAVVPSEMVELWSAHLVKKSGERCLVRVVQECFSHHP